MRSLAATLCALALALPTSARAEAPRFAPTLRLFAAGGLPSEALRGGRGRVPVAVRLPGGAATLSRMGIAAREGGGDTAYADVSPDELAAIAQRPGVVAIDRPRLLYPTLDRSVAATGAAPLRPALGLDGKGVAVGVVDTGIDFRHGDFRTAGGKTRIAALLDVNVPRTGSHPMLPDYNKAQLWLADEIDAVLTAEAQNMTPAAPIAEADTGGHGTHVASIAAGNGLATGNALPAGRYVGMAPAATLFVAHAARGQGFDEADTLAGLRFILDRAAAAQLPVAVNLSIGGDGGPHDGSTSFERGIADLFPDDKPGRCIVISAGNSGSRDRHAGGDTITGGVSLHLKQPSGAPVGQVLSVEMWFDGPAPAITLTAPDGKSFAAAPGKSIDETDPGVARVLLDAASHGPDPINHHYEAVLYVMGPTSGVGVAPGTWTLSLAGPTGRWDAWLTDLDSGTVEPRFVEYLDEDRRGDYPAYTTTAIIAGSYITRNGWLTPDGRQIVRPTVVGRASSFTATGPTADGRFFPDVAAPGEFILAALSRDAPPTDSGSAFFVDGDPNFLLADDGVHAALRGTSMAAPHVTGAAALLFQLDPTLTPRRIRELLRASAVVERGAPGYSTRLGFGKLDVGRAAALLGRRPTGAADAAASTIGTNRDAVAPGDGQIVVSVVPKDATGAPLGPGRTVSIESDRGEWGGEVRDLGDGRYERTLLAHAPRNASATVSAKVDGTPLVARPVVWFVTDRTDAGRPFTALGGCALSPPASPLGALVLAGLALAALLARRRR